MVSDAERERWLSRALVVCAMGLDPMAQHHDCCTCWRCDAVRDIWWAANEAAFAELGL
jgi:hypothetical protein